MIGDIMAASSKQGPMTAEAPQDPEERGRVLKFRPREAPNSAPKTGTIRPGAFGNLARGAAEPESSVRDLSRFSSDKTEPDDFTHRMKMNALVAVVLVVLTGCGMWIIDTMASVRKNQDCVLSGRRNCMVISAPAADR
jgi:hypothetical protein